jgi:hypothetical protein
MEGHTLVDLETAAQILLVSHFLKVIIVNANLMNNLCESLLRKKLGGTQTIFNFFCTANSF